jgi:hypothetical protein
MFARAKLSFVGSATLAENIDAISIPEKIRPRLEQTGDAIFRELLRDFASNRGFRRDLFARGSGPLTRVEHHRALGGIRFALAVPPSRLKWRFQGLLGEVNGQPEFYTPIAEVLSKRISTFDELKLIPIFQKIGPTALIQALLLLVHSGQALPIVKKESIDPNPSQRFNRAVATAFKNGRPYVALASPVTGTGIGVSQQELLALVTHLDGKDRDVDEATRYGLELLGALGQLPMKEGKAAANSDEAFSILKEQMTEVFTEVFPVWRRLGVLHESQGNRSAKK